MSGAGSDPLAPWLRRALARLLDGEEGRALASELRELYERRRDRDGERAAAAWLRRESRRTLLHLVADRLRRDGARSWPERRRPGRLAGTARGLGRDLRHGLRSIARAPAVSATIAASVGIGIGATTAAYGVLDAVLIRPLPYSGAGDFVRIYTDSPPHRWPFSVADYLALEEQQTQLEDVAGYTSTALTYTADGVAERLDARVVTWNYFSLLGIRPLHGPGFAASDGRPGSEPAVVVSYVFWSRHLGRDPMAVGRAIRLDDREHRVAGVLPPEPGPLESGRDLFVAAQWETPPRRGPFFIGVVARVTPQKRAAAAHELRAINDGIFPLWQATYSDQRASWGMIDLSEQLVGDARAPLLVATAAVGLMLLIACANAANLLLARAVERRRELAVRGALGASRGRLVRLLLCESALLAAVAAGIGVLVATVAFGLAATTGSEHLPRSEEIRWSASSARALALLALGSGLLFGWGPSLQAASAAGTPLTGSERSGTASARSRRLQRFLVAGQFAVSTPLLIGAALVALSFAKLHSVDPRVRNAGVVSGAVLLPQSRYAEPGAVATFWEELEARVEALPGVQAVAFADGRPPAECAIVNNFDLEDDPTPAGESQPAVPWVAVSPDYFRAMGISLIRGRPFDERDGGAEGDQPVIVDRAWARRFFPSQDAVGKRLLSGGCTPATCPWAVVVGVVSDVKYSGLDAPDAGVVYWPLAARSPDHPIETGTPRFRYILARTAGDPAAGLTAIGKVVRELDPTVPLTDTATLDALMAESLAVPRRLSALVGGFGMLALALALVGVYGVMSYFVRSHRREIGVRLAVGGRPAGIQRLVIGRGLALVATGLAAGLPAAFALTRSLSSVLFEVEPRDPLTFAGVPAAMLGVALLACLGPARRAAGVDPATTLREE